MAEIYYWLDKSRAKKGTNQYPIKLMLNHRRRALSLKMEHRYYCEIANWDESSRTVKKSYPNSKRVNNWLMTMRLEADDLLIDIAKAMSLQQLTSHELRDMVNAARLQNAHYEDPTNQEGGKGVDELTLFQCSLEAMKTYHEPNSKKWIKEGMQAVLNANGRQDILMKDITVQFLKDMKAAHLERGNGKNGLAIYLSAVRRVFNITTERIPEFIHYPFGRGKFSIQTEKTPSRAVDVEMVTDAIRALKIDPSQDRESEADWRAQQYMLWMFCCRGMNFIDLAKLKKSNILNPVYKDQKLVEGILHYRRSKNSKLFHFPLPSEAIEILNRFQLYLKDDEDDVFPIGFVKSETGLNTYNQKRARYNNRFSKLVALAGFDKRVTSYVIRHTFASELKHNGVPDSGIQEILGHDDPRVTKVYTADHREKTLNEFVGRVVAA